MAKIFVTGGAGYVGAHVCKALARAGHTPVVYDNLSRGRREAVKFGPFEDGDVTDCARLKAALTTHSPAAVVHLAGFAYVHESIAEPLRYYANNVAGTLTLLAAMREARVDRIVASSSCTVYASRPTPLDEAAPLGPASPYATSKVIMEQALRDCAAAYGLRWMALRYFNAAGADPDGEVGETTDAGVRVIPNLFETALGRRAVFQIHGDDYPTSDGTCVRDFTHVTDIAEGHLRALDYSERADASAPRVFNLGTGKGLSIRAMIAAVETVTGRKIPVVVGPRRTGDPPSLVSDPALAIRTLGWQALWPDAVDMIRHAWAWHRSAGADRSHAATG